MRSCPLQKRLVLGKARLRCSQPNPLCLHVCCSPAPAEKLSPKHSCGQSDAFRCDCKLGPPPACSLMPCHATPTHAAKMLLIRDAVIAGGNFVVLYHQPGRPADCNGYQCVIFLEAVPTLYLPNKHSFSSRYLSGDRADYYSLMLTALD